MESLVNAQFWAGKRVLLTGHSGFKGAWLSLWLEFLGARVTGYSLPPSTHPSLWELAAHESAVESIFADIRDRAALVGAIKTSRPEIVFHLAAQSLVRASYHDPVGTYETNIMGTVNLLEALRNAPELRAVVVVTSDKCYENHEDARAYKEGDPMGGLDPYSSSKGCAELVTAAYRASFYRSPGSAAIASARAGNVIGGGDWAADRIVPDAVRAITAGRPLLVRNPSAVRPWQHVLEPLAGYLQLAEKLYKKPEDFAEGWNFGPDEADAVPVEQVVSMFVGLWGPSARWERDGAQHPYEAHLLKLDSTKARGSLRWEPRLGLKNALRWTVEWYKKQHEGASARALTLEQIRRYMEFARA